jgi:hypothetical protein
MAALFLESVHDGKAGIPACAGMPPVQVEKNKAGHFRAGGNLL